jgi:hypothetical protein
MSRSKALRVDKCNVISHMHTCCVFILFWYIGNMKTVSAPPAIQRTQTGVRMETRLLKVLKALAELHDMSLGDLLEGLVLHAFEGKAPFSEATLKHITALKQVYGLDLTFADAHRLNETENHHDRS